MREKHPFEHTSCAKSGRKVGGAADRLAALAYRRLLRGHCARPPGETLSNQPRPDSPPPDGTEPTTPLDGPPTPPGATPASRPAPPDATAAPVSGQPWATPSGDPLSPEPDQPPATAPQPPTFKPGYASLPEPPDPDYPPTSQFPPTASYPATASGQGYPPPVNYAPPGYAPDYGPAGHAPGHPGSGHPGQGQPGSGYPGQGQPGQGYPDPAYQGQGYPPPGYPPGYPQPPHPGGPGPAGKPPRKSSVPIIAVIVAVTLLLCGGVATAGVLIARNVADRAEQAVDDLPTFDPVEPELPGLPTDLPGLPTELPQAPTGAPGSIGRTISVTYEVTGDGPASQILYVEKLGEAPKRLENVKLPWKFTAKMETPALLSVVAMRIDTSEGEISCRALVDGAEVKQRTSDPGTVATASCTHFALE